MSMQTLQSMGDALNADVAVLRERQGLQGRVAEVLVRKVADEDYEEVRCCVLGNADSGKSTLVGVLSSGDLDNGERTALSFSIQS